MLFAFCGATGIPPEFTVLIGFEQLVRAANVHNLLLKISEGLPVVTIGMNYEVIEGKEEIFVKAFKAVLEAMKSLPGHQDSRLFENVFQKGSFLILSSLETETQFRAFVDSDQFKKVVTWGKEQILKGRPSHQVYHD